MRKCCLCLIVWESTFVQRDLPRFCELDLHLLALRLDGSRFLVLLHAAEQSSWLSFYPGALTLRECCCCPSFEVWLPCINRSITKTCEDTDHVLLLFFIKRPRLLQSWEIVQSFWQQKSEIGDRNLIECPLVPPIGLVNLAQKGLGTRIQHGGCV